MRRPVGVAHTRGMAATRFLKAGKLAGAAMGAARAADRRFTWGERIAAIPAMLAATLRGRFPGATRKGVLLSAAGLVYLVSPIDLMPELLLGPFGIADDAAIAAMSMGYLVSAADRYLHWRTGTVPAPEHTPAGRHPFDADVVQGTVVDR